jgi:hypothetical protein
MTPIPISAAKAIAIKYGYDQIVIIARAVGEGEHVTTYGQETHKWEPDFSDGERIDCKTCGVCGTTHQSSVEDAALIDKQYLQICVLKADLDNLHQTKAQGRTNG